MDNEKLKTLFTSIRVIAKRQTSYDEDGELDIMGISGGNFDNAYYAGSEDGMIEYARSLVKDIEKL